MITGEIYHNWLKKQYKNTPTHKKPPKAMNDYEIVNFYQLKNFKGFTIIRLAILENELFDRGFKDIVKITKKHNLSDISAIYSSLASRDIIPLPF